MDAEVIRPTRARRAGPAERLALAMGSRIAQGHLTVRLPDGTEHVFRGEGSGPRAELRVHDARVFRRILSGGATALAEAYMDGDWDSPGPVALIELGARNQAALERVLDGRPWGQLARRFAHLLRRNSKRGARRNIAAHYDLGNEFYARWLDPTMTYSAAVFESPDADLAAAQDSKFRRLAELAGIKPRDHVLELGCGWGGFCEWAAREIGCRITAITISQEQHEYTLRRMRKAGLADRVEVRLQDYRDVTGRFDAIVSIEMLEAVGERYWPTFFRVLRDRLAPGGRAALQVITIDDAHFAAYRGRADFIQRYIFPGGMLPAPSAVRREAIAAGLAWEKSVRYGDHYIRTLALWHRRFDEAWPDIRAQGFDERFRRMWKYYLAYCEAGFRTGRIDVLQFGLRRD